MSHHPYEKALQLSHAAYRFAGIVAAVAIGCAAASAAVGDVPTLLDAHRAFYNARYDEAATLAQTLEVEAPGDLAACELRSSALLFQIKTAIGSLPDREKAFAQCASCAALLASFVADTTRGQALARARLAVAPDDEVTLFLLGKLDLNYVWLQLGPLGRKKGWDEYWEARRSLDAVLKRHPEHVRARVARAWIDYIVDTRMPRGTRWVLGGGDRKRALRWMQEAADTEAPFFVHVEALFALWELEVREGRVPAAAEIARTLLREFPDNPELVRFVNRVK